MLAAFDDHDITNLRRSSKVWRETDCVWEYYKAVCSQKLMAVNEGPIKQFLKTSLQPPFPLCFQLQLESVPDLKNPLWGYLTNFEFWVHRIFMLFAWILLYLNGWTLYEK